MSSTIPSSDLLKVFQSAKVISFRRFDSGRPSSRCAVRSIRSNAVGDLSLLQLRPTFYALLADRNQVVIVARDREYETLGFSW